MTWAMMSREKMRDWHGHGSVLKKKMEDIILGKLSYLDIKQAMLDRASQLEKSEREEDLRELYVLQRATMQMDTGHMSYVNKISDMSAMESLMVNTRNFRNDILRWVVKQGETAAMSYKSLYKTWNDKFQIVVKNVIKTYKEDNTFNVSQMYSDVAEKYYDNMFVRVPAKIRKTQTINGKTYKAGDTYMAKLPLLYSSEADVTAKQITKEQLKLVEFIQKSLNDALVDMELHRLRKENPKATIEDAKAKAKEMNIGDVFVIPKSINELFWDKQFKKSFDRYSSSLGFTEDALDINYEKIISASLKISNMFQMQISDNEKRYEMMGLNRVYDENGNTSYEILNIEANNEASSNLERMLQSFKIEGLREEFYEREVVPRYNMAMGAFNFLESTGDHSLKKNKEALMDLIDRTLGRKVKDMKDDKFSTPFGDVYFGKILRSSLGTAAFSFLAFSVRIGRQSALYNATNQWISSLSNKIADMGITVGEKSQMIGPKNVYQATRDVLKQALKEKVFNGDLIRLAWKLGGIHNTERDLTSIWNRSGNVSNIFQDDIAHLMNAGTDIMSRVIATAAILGNNGSLDAYTWNDAKNDFDYDITKDRLYADENGKISPTKIIEIRGDNGLIDRLVEQKRMILDKGETKENVPLSKIPTGYDSSMIVRQIQYYADKFVLASINEWNRNLLASTYVGAAASQFRVFSFEKAFNMGLFAGTRYTNYGTGYEIVEIDGKKFNKETIRQIEGSIQSLAHTKDALKHMLRGDFLKWWNQQPAIRRVNIIRTMLKTTLAAMIYFGIKMAKIPERDRHKYTFVMGDLGMAFMMKDIIENPYPILGYINTIIDGVTGERDIVKVLKTHTPAKALFQFEDIGEYFDEYLEAN
jgi:hypothetical protein